MLEETATRPAASKGPVAVVLGVILGLGGMFGYSIHEHNQAAQLSQQNQQLASTLNDTHSQMDSLNSKLNGLVEAQQLAAKQAAERAQEARVRATRSGTQRRRVEESRLKKLQEELQAKLDEQGKAIDATRQDLQATGTELRGSIARTHGELVVLQRKGERNYYEFDLDKSKQFQRAGPVGISLRKASTKDRYADLKLIVDDAQLTQKHLNLYQPVMFYAGDTGAPLELVVNSVTKNHVHGYVSEPKYRSSELKAMSDSTQQPGGAVDTTAANSSQTAGGTANGGASSTPPARTRARLSPPIQ